MNMTKFQLLGPRDFETSWKSPSNIAFVKYWGKKGHQLPANASLSMTLRECTTTTKISFKVEEKFSVKLFLDGIFNPAFSAKVSKFFESLFPLFPWIEKVGLHINTTNNFPHGTGIASSASGMSAICLCFTDYLYFLSGLDEDKDFFKTASFLSRLGSGSACRSVYGDFAIWGKCLFTGSSDEFAIPFQPHNSFNGLQDSVIIFSSEEKKFSSRYGHGLMQGHYFAESRFRQANKNFTDLLHSMEQGDFFTFGRILEVEALSLHAMMMSSPEPYMLMKPQTIAAIELINDFRTQTDLPLFYTLDAGPNLHLIYPENLKEKIQTFIHHELEKLAEKVIHDQQGDGPQRC
jgi:diphosphomevalonate decarboxylase